MTAALCGTYNPSIDRKGRMSFPNKLREILGPEFYLCIGHDNHYIAVYSPEEFEAYQSKLYTIPGQTGSNIRRKLLACADKQTPDKQGRIFIAQNLRDHAGINTDDKEVIVIGASNRAEIWDKATWEKFNNDITIEDINAALDDIVL